MNGSIVIKDNSCILNDADRDKFSGGVVFRLDSGVLQGFRLDLFRSVDIPTELEVEGEPNRCIHACITVELIIM